MKSFAFVFPGQGSQAVGMLDAWGDVYEQLLTLVENFDFDGALHLLQSRQQASKQ